MHFVFYDDCLHVIIALHATKSDLHKFLTTCFLGAVKWHNFVRCIWQTNLRAAKTTLTVKCKSP